MKTSRTFGVEIELNGDLRYPVSGKMGWVSNYQHPGHQHRPDYVKMQLQPGWKAVYDGSCGCEFVSPPLVDTAPIMRQICAIRQSGFPIEFSDAGIHIHVGAHDLSRTNLIELLKFCRHFSRTIYSFVRPDRYSNSYCRPLQMSDTEIASRYPIQSNLMHSDRYRGCNITSYDKHGTVEYRYSESTLDYNKIVALVDLFVKITDWVAGHKGRTRVESPRKKEAKKRFLLELVGVRDETFTILMNTKY